MIFHVRQRVVCVDADGAPALARGRVYTVRAVETRVKNWRDGISASAVWLVEADCCPGYDGYAAARFRPLDERRLDEFRAHLTGAPAEAAGRGTTPVNAPNDGAVVITAFSYKACARPASRSAAPP